MAGTNFPPLRLLVIYITAPGPAPDNNAGQSKPMEVSLCGSIACTLLRSL